MFALQPHRMSKQKRRPHPSVPAAPATQTPETDKRPPHQPGVLLPGLAITVAWLMLWPATSQAQITMQLPTVGVFNVRTVVMAPDGGSIHLGGVNRSAYGRTSRGVPLLGQVPGAGRLFRNSGTGRFQSAANSQARVRILSLSEMEREVMEEAARQQTLSDHHNPNGSPDTQEKADFITRNIGRFNKKK